MYLVSVDRKIGIVVRTTTKTYQTVKKALTKHYTYFMASHISSPIFTQFLAWLGREIGSPETQ